MAKFRKKPIIVEAVQWRAGRPLIGPLPANSGPRDGDYLHYVMVTANGPVDVWDGTWVVTDPATGDAWPVRADIFEATYEPAPQEAS